jgi:hypothetical protein
VAWYTFSIWRRAFSSFFFASSAPIRFAANEAVRPRIRGRDAPASLWKLPSPRRFSLSEPSLLSPLSRKTALAGCSMVLAVDVLWYVVGSVAGAAWGFAPVG